MTDRPMTIDIRHPLIVKGNEIFAVVRRDGCIPTDVKGMGLFYRDCCFLERYVLHIDGTEPVFLGSGCPAGPSADIQMTNRRARLANGGDLAPHMLGIRRRLEAPDGEGSIRDTVRFAHYGDGDVDIWVSLDFSAPFEDIMTARGSGKADATTIHPPVVNGDELRFSATGGDGIERSLVATFSAMPILDSAEAGHTRARFRLHLRRGEETSLVTILHVGEEGYAPARRPDSARNFTRIASDHAPLDRAIKRCCDDIRTLGVERPEGRFPAAGLPWFGALFGRDTLIPAIQFLAFDSGIAAETVRILSRYQGRGKDSEHGEEPGKIMHELRVGPLANQHLIPETPSFHSVDSTPLFLIALGEHARWSGGLDIFRDLRDSVAAALDWMLGPGDSDGDGYLDYDGQREGWPANKGWKDSREGVIRADGSPPEPPIALAEVQGYAWRAMRLAADLFEADGDGAAAERLRREAETRRTRFNQDFWMEDEGCYCLGLEKGGRQIRSVASNGGQVLWSGIADDDKAARTAARLMRPDMFSGWGIRTLSADHPRFDPLSYHCGSVWPHDNALILAGFRRYGEDAAALRLFAALLEAAEDFPHYRLPEFFAGFRREGDSGPAHTPRADPLQAWSLGALPLMLASLLGVEPDPRAKRPRVVRPVLPPWVGELTLEDVRVGERPWRLRFTRDEDGALTAVG